MPPLFKADSATLSFYATNDRLHVGPGAGRGAHRRTQAKTVDCTVIGRSAPACVGLSCWPDTPPIKHRSAYRVTLQPVW